MLRPKFYITITKESGDSIEFNFCNQFETNEGYEFLTDTASVIVPRKLSQNGLPLFTGADPIFKRKDRITIEAGYFPNRVTVFEGFISHVSANIPVRLECEDNMFLFKQFRVTYPKTFVTRTRSKKGRLLKHPKIISENITLKQLIDYIFNEGEYNDLLDGITYEVLDDIKLGQFRASNATPAQVFEKLRDLYGLFIYFVGSKLYLGFASNAANTQEKEYIMERVCINSNELEYQRSEDITIRVKCISILPDNTRVEAEAGDPDGEQRTYHYYNITSEADLKKIAEKRVGEYKYTGFRGYFETFGQPLLRHGDRLKMVSTKLPERNGVYLVKSVKRMGSVNGGYRQVFELGQKLD
jgi:hypothetical protein